MPQRSDDGEKATQPDSEPETEAMSAELLDLQRQLQSLDSDVPPASGFDLERMLSKLATLDHSQFLPGETPLTVDESPADADDFIKTPDQFGEYRILKVLGRGGVGTVYHARHTLLDREVAIKLLRGERDGPEDPSRVLDAAKRFRREMKVVGRLSNPHVVAASDARVVEGRMMLVMQYIAGHTFQQQVARHGPLPVSTACDFIRQTCLGLASVHELGIIHRDIKPSNLMVDDQGVVKILDLGLASLRHMSSPAESNIMDQPDSEHASLTRPSCIMGTVDYISPEQIDDPRLADARSDLYSLGCVFYYLLTGQPPFNRDDYPSDVARLMAHASLTPKPVSKHRTDLPPSINTLIANLLEKSPENRPQSASEVRDQIE